MTDFVIRQASSHDHDQLIDLWHACFPNDPADYAEKFLAALPTDAVTLVGEVDISVVTMLFLLPAKARFCNRTYPVRYLYAGCTHPQHRGKGYYRSLMHAAAQLVEKTGEYAIFLHPADDTLDSTYRRLGYQSGIAGRQHCPLPADLSECNDTATYLQARQAVLDVAMQTAVSWEIDENTTQFFLKDAISHGAKMYISERKVALTIENTVIELLQVNETGMDNSYCLWLPVGTSDLINDMKENGGYTGMIGE